jgi:3-phenylpropionate/trans-cinnamate dioxygenase ferredoxin reductase subunit
VIVGSGLAGAFAAKTLREEGYTGRIVLVGNEAGLPFGRPPLSKTYLRGEEEIAAWLVAPADWYDAHEVELLRATATGIDSRAHHVELDDRRIEYEMLLIATGGRNRRLNVTGANLPGIFQLRTVAECDAIKRAAHPGAVALVVGMGFIGSEVAASLRQIGCHVMAVMPGSAPLESVLGPEVGRVMAGIHTDAGVKLISQDSVESFEGAGRLERAVTRSGRVIDCELAVVAVGIQPNVEMLADSGVAVDNGVLVDAGCRTNVERIYAAGDVANHMHPLFGRIRVEHYNNAEKQGAAAARSMLRPNVEYGYLHTFWSDQYEHKLEYAGHARSWDRFDIRGSLTDRSFVGFYKKSGVLRAAVGLNRGGDPEQDLDGEMAEAARLIAAGDKPDV